MAENKRALIDIHADILSILRLVEYNDGEMTDEIELKLSELRLEAREKILSVCGWFKRLDMEIEGVKLHKKEVSERLSALENLKERLRRWIFKGAKLANIVRGDTKNGWEGDKIENAQIRLSWRRSEGVKLDESAHGFTELHKNFPEFFDFKIRVKDREAGLMLMDLIESGMFQIQETDIRKSIAEEHLKKQGALPISGIEIEKRINPQIK